MIRTVLVAALAFRADLARWEQVVKQAGIKID
jgi:hypothetical protein